jgi:hypothetical protein
MSKFGKALKVLYWILRRPHLLNRLLTDEDSWHSFVGKKYRMASGFPVVHMDQLIASESLELGPMTFLDGSSLPTYMMLLAGLAEQIQDCSYFEIGTWRGESVATVSPRALSCHTLCLSDEEMQQRGMHPGIIVSHMQFSANLENVTQLRGDSREFDFARLDRIFDVIFIDGDHHYDFVLNDTKNVFRHLVHEKSIVVWHDYGFHPDKLRYEVMAAILNGAGAERAKRIYHVAHTKSAIFTGEELQTAPADFTRVPGEFYKTRMSRQKINESPS